MIEVLKRFFWGGEAGSIFRGMTTLMFGASAARFVGFMSIPLLTRIYTPEDYGVLSTYVALVTILGPSLSLRYAQAIPLPRADNLALNLLTLSLLLIFASSILLASLFWLYGAAILGWMSMEILAPWWWLVLLGGIGTALYEVLSSWATRKRVYGIIARTQFTQSLLGEGVKVVAGLFSYKPIGLLIGHLVSQSAGLGAFLFKFRDDFRKGFRCVRSRRIFLAFIKYLSFPIHRLPSQFLLAFSMQAPLIFSLAIYGAEVAGQLGLALMVLALPVTLIANAAGRSYYAEAAEIGKRDPVRLERITRLVISRLAIISIFPTFILLFFGREIFVTVFGAEWAMSGDMASILSIYLLFNFISNPVQHLFSVMDKNMVYLQLSIQRSLLVVGCFGVSKIYGIDILYCIGAYSLLMCLHYIVVSARVLVCVRSYNSRPIC